MIEHVFTLFYFVSVIILVVIIVMREDGGKTDHSRIPKRNIEKSMVELDDKVCFVCGSSLTIPQKH